MPQMNHKNRYVRFSKRKLFKPLSDTLPHRQDCMQCGLDCPSDLVDNLERLNFSDILQELEMALVVHMFCVVYSRKKKVET